MALGLRQFYQGISLVIIGVLLLNVPVYAGLSGGISIPVLQQVTEVQEVGANSTTTYLTNIPNVVQRITFNDYASTTVINALVLQHLLTGTATDTNVGRGVGISFMNEDIADNATNTAQIASALTQTSTSSPSSNLTFSIKTQTGSLTEVMRIASSSVGVATTSPSEEFSLVGDTYQTSNATTSLTVDSTGTNLGGCIELRGANGTMYRIFVNPGNTTLVTEAGYCKP